jgi:hypothetical protein
MRRLLQTPLALAALGLLTVAASAPARAGDPFTGTTASDTTSLDIGDCFDYTEFDLTGCGTPLGKFTGRGQQTVNYCFGPDVEGDVTLTDENGDQISLHYVGTRVDLFTYVCEMSATGGTGRYQGATVDGTLTIEDYGIDLPFDASFDGTIQFP